jgi:ABC-type glycerol-3-phosphate transport system substrate-binding protein
VLLDLAPFIERDGFDVTALADAGVAHFTTADGGQYGLPRDLNVTALYYNKAMFTRPACPIPTRHGPGTRSSRWASS